MVWRFGPPTAEERGNLSEIASVVAPLAPLPRNDTVIRLRRGYKCKTSSFSASTCEASVPSGGHAAELLHRLEADLRMTEAGSVIGSGSDWRRAVSPPTAGCKSTNGGGAWQSL
ncbi:MAG: hypothetical protein ACP5ON_00465 [Bacteroidota bacterium]